MDMDMGMGSRGGIRGSRGGIRGSIRLVGVGVGIG